MDTFETDTLRFFKSDLGSKHMAQGPTAERKLAGRQVGTWVRLGDDPWVWVVWPDVKVKPARLQYRDFDAELDHPIV
jgi:hypothetical protein